jgi:hypothetical protein
MIATDEELDSRRVILLRDIVKSVLPMTVPTLRQRMAEQSIPEIHLGKRKTGILLRDLDVLLSNSTRSTEATND